MSTTLEEARKALLLAQQTGARGYYTDMAVRLQMIADYLDNQVPLAVENEQLRAKLAHAESFMNTTNALPSQQQRSVKMFAPNNSNRAFRINTAVPSGPDIVGFRSHQLYAKDAGKELRELTKEEKQRYLDGEFQNAKAMSTENIIKKCGDRLQHAREIKEQFDACAAMQFNLVSEAINNPAKMHIGLLNTWGGAAPAGPQPNATIEDILKDCNDLIAKSSSVPIVALGNPTSTSESEMRATEALSKLPPLHWCLKDDCNCNACVKERGYVV